jgi:methyl-accepting chemotaxis protein
LVDRCVIWQLLLKYGIQPKIVNLIRVTYNGYKCQVVHEGKLTEPFGVTSGVRQGCILSTIIFLLVIDDIMRKSTQRKRGLQWGLLDRLADLDYADDICLLTHSFQHMKEKLKELEIEARKAGLKINSRKTKEMRLLSTSRERFVLDGQEIEEVDHFVTWEA